MSPSLPPLALLTILLPLATPLLEVLHSWPYLDFDFPYDYPLLTAFQPENTVFTGLEVTQSRFFLAVPRLRSGVPATLAYVRRNREKSPTLQAYPDWGWHMAGRGGNLTMEECQRSLVSVYRVRTDRCGRLWVLDSGVTTSLDDFRRLCPPKLVLFDLATDSVVRQIIFPQRVLRPASLLTNLIIDESLRPSSNCDGAYAYISDTAAPGLVVLDLQNGTAWRVMHPTMFPDPAHSTHMIGGEAFTLMDGVVGLAHSPALGVVYYQPLATDRIFRVRVSELVKGPLKELEELQVDLLGRKSSTGIGLAVNQGDETLYFSPLTETAVASFNPLNGQQKILAFDPEKLQFLSEIRHVQEEGRLYALSTRFQKFFRRSVTPKEINMRIVRLPDRIPAHQGENSIFYH